MRRLNKLQRENLVYLLFGIFFVVGGYFFLRIAYKLSDHLPFTQEIVLIVLGTIVTVLITAMLLNKQTEVELKKEENVKFLDLKTEVYFDLLARIEEILLSGHAGDDDLLRLRFLSHRLAVVACPPVLEQYEAFVRVFHQAARDSTFADDEEDAISHQLARLTVTIREDLVGELDAQSDYSRSHISRQIMENSDLQNSHQP